MQEVSKCALCGYTPMNLIQSGVEKISCCGITCDVLRWNRVQAALRAEKELKELKAAADKVAWWWRNKDTHCSVPPAPMLLDNLACLCGGEE